MALDTCPKRILCGNDQKITLHIPPLSANPTHDVEQTGDKLASYFADCFLQDFSRYSPIMPVIPTELYPDETFSESPSKFWVIVTIGSCRIREDPTLLQKLSSRVINLALMPLHLGSTSPLSTIEALIITCTWHLSKNKPFFKSIYFTLSGSLFHLAPQIGLHRCASLQGPQINHGMPDLLIVRRTNLWVNVMTVYQRYLTLLISIYSLHVLTQIQ